MNKFALALVGAVVLATPAAAQSAYPSRPSPEGPPASGTVVGGQNNTGGDVEVTVPRGPTGADTYQSNSAAAGNANQPSRAVPQGSGGGGSGSGTGN